jgi:hypothetical protein
MPFGTTPAPSSRTAALESTINCVSVSFAIFVPFALRQLRLSPARPRDAQGQAGEGDGILAGSPT